MPLGLGHSERQVFIVVAGAETALGREGVRFSRSHRTAKPVMIAVDWTKVQCLGPILARDINARGETFHVPRDAKLHPFTFRRIYDLQQPIRKTGGDLDGLWRVMMRVRQRGRRDPYLGRGKARQMMEELFAIVLGDVCGRRDQQPFIDLDRCFNV